MITYADVPLELGLDDDVPLPFGDRVEELSPEAEVARLRRALVDVLAHVNGDPAPAFRVRAWRELAGLPKVTDEPATPEDRRDEGIARAAAKWTDEEVAAVDAAIAHVAAQARHDARTRKVGDGLEEFTTADVWAELGVDFPVTKGIAGRFVRYTRDPVEGIILDHVDATRVVTREDTRHCHADGQGPCLAADCPIAGQRPRPCPGATGPQHPATPRS